MHQLADIVQVSLRVKMNEVPLKLPILINIAEQLPIYLCIKYEQFKLLQNI